jgi:hypothetical protein
MHFRYILPTYIKNKIVPLGYNVAKRTASFWLTEWDTTIHTSEIFKQLFFSMYCMGFHLCDQASIPGISCLIIIYPQSRVKRVLSDWYAKHHKMCSNNGSIRDDPYWTKMTFHAKRFGTSRSIMIMTEDADLAVCTFSSFSLGWLYISFQSFIRFLAGL